MYFSNTYIESKILPKFQGKERELHVKKVQKWTFDCLYYTLTSIYSYKFFGGTPWYPINFSDKQEDDTLGLFTEWPSTPQNQSYFKYFEFFLAV